MEHIRTPRFWLLTTAALIFGSYAPANAQVSSSYNYGTPTMVAAAPSLPSVPAEQIARDVTSEYNPRSGRTELAAAPFDPFEEDPRLAGSLRLRSADGSVSIDGQNLQHGAIVEVDFYYNSPSDDPYGGRNYGDASFVNGELAPVSLRDTRILECSTRVNNVVYDHSSYYGRSSRIGIYRPYRHYAGHFGFGYGFGSNYFGPGYGYYNRHRSHYNRNRGYARGHGSRSNFNRRILDQATGGRSSGLVRGDRDRDRDRDRNRDRDRDRDSNRDQGRAGVGDSSRTGTRRLTAQERENRLRAIQAHGSAMPWSGAARRGGRTTLRSETPAARIAIGEGASTTRSQSGTVSQSRTPKVTRQISQSDLKRPESRSQGARRNETSERRETRRSEPRIGVSSRSAPRSESISEPSRSGTRQTQPKRSTSAPSRPSRAASPRPSTQKPSSSRSSSSRSSSSRSSSSRSSSSRSSRSSSTNRGSRSRQLYFFPNDGYGARQVVTSKSVDCAREDKLRVFVPNERLDAARFDGLTLIALDAQGGETPIYIPPNYIEGFRLASSGSVRPQGYKQVAPVVVTPQTGSTIYGATSPNRVIEAAPCPSGTSKQPDGTCLQTSGFGYPIQ